MKQITLLLFICSAIFAQDFRTETVRKLTDSLVQWDNVPEQFRTPSISSQGSSIRTSYLPAISEDGSKLCYIYSELSCCIGLSTELIVEDRKNEEESLSWIIDGGEREESYSELETEQIYNDITSTIDFSNYKSMVYIKDYQQNQTDSTCTAWFVYDGEIYETELMTNPRASARVPSFSDDEPEIRVEFPVELNTLYYSPEHQLVLVEFLHYSASDGGERGPFFHHYSVSAMDR